MNNKSEISNYSHLSPNEKIIVREYAKAILRAKLISLIPDINHRFENIPVDESLLNLIDEIQSHDEHNPPVENLLEEAFKPFNNALSGNVLSCAECLLRNNWDRDQCKSECNIPLKPPDED